MGKYVNKFGRKGGRGVRPLLLIPKVLGVAVYFGGVTAATALAFSTRPATVDEYHALGDALGRIFLFAAVPGLILTIVCGIALLVYHGRPFLRLRWLQVKLALLAVTIPLLHLWMSTHVESLRTFDPAQDSLSPELTLLWIKCGLVAAMLTAALVIVIGRHKPRLGQLPALKAKIDEVAT